MCIRDVEEDEDNGFKQRFDHFVNGDFNERRGVVGINNFHPLREEGLQLGKFRFNRRSGI